nr:O-antigen ligase family protein [Candidatus Levybacteria bacterium]
MIKKLFQNQREKEEKESWLLSQDSVAKFFFYLLILFLPTQFGKHFWPQFSFIQGLRLDYLSPTIYLTDILILLIIFFSLKKILIFLKTQNKKNIYLILLFFLSLFVGVATSKNQQAGFYGIIKVIEYILLGIFVATSFKEINKKYFMYILISGIVFESILSILQILNNGSLNGLFYYFGERYFTSQTPGIANASISGQLFLRPYGTFPHPNVLAGYLIIAMGFILKFKNTISKRLLFLSILIGTTSLALTLSRIAILFWFTYLFFLFCISLREKYKKRNSSKKNTITITIIILSSALMFIFSLQMPFVQRFTQTKFSEESVVQREYLINQSWGMFIKNPMLGVGINNFYNNLENSKEKSLFIQPVHNIFLFVLSQAGLIGLIYFLFVLYKNLKNVNKSGFLLISALIVLGMFDHYFLTIQQGQIMILLIFSQAFSVKINK